MYLDPVKVNSFSTRDHFRDRWNAFWVVPSSACPYQASSRCQRVWRLWTLTWVPRLALALDVAFEPCAAARFFLEQLRSRFLCGWRWWCRWCLHQSVLSLSAETGGCVGGGCSAYHRVSRDSFNASTCQAAVCHTVSSLSIIRPRTPDGFTFDKDDAPPGTGGTTEASRRNVNRLKAAFPSREKKTSRRVCLYFIIWGQAYAAFMWSQNQTVTINPRQSAATKRSLSELMPDVVPAWSNKSRLRALSWRLIVLIWVNIETASCRRPRAHNTFYYG